eukprot:16438415-Heterocapsa_arctica.AAC.1
MSVLWMCNACPPKNWRHRHSRVSGECRLAAGGAPDAHPPVDDAPAAAPPEGAPPALAIVPAPAPPAIQPADAPP